MAHSDAVTAGAVVAKRAGYGLAIKTSGRTGERTVFAATPPIRSWFDRRRVHARVRAMLADAQVPRRTRVFINTPDASGVPRQKEFSWR